VKEKGLGLCENGTLIRKGRGTLGGKSVVGKEMKKNVFKEDGNAIEKGGDLA